MATTSSSFYCAAPGCNTTSQPGARLRQVAYPTPVWLQEQAEKAGLLSTAFPRTPKTGKISMNSADWVKAITDNKDVFGKVQAVVDTYRWSQLNAAGRKRVEVVRAAGFTLHDARKTWLRTQRLCDTHYPRPTAGPSDAERRLQERVQINQERRQLEEKERAHAERRLLEEQRRAAEEARAAEVSAHQAWKEELEQCIVDTSRQAAQVNNNHDASMDQLLRAASKLRKSMVYDTKDGARRWLTAGLNDAATDALQFAASVAKDRVEHATGMSATPTESRERKGLYRHENLPSEIRDNPRVFASLFAFPSLDAVNVLVELVDTYYPPRDVKIYQEADSWAAYHKDGETRPRGVEYDSSDDEDYSPEHDDASSESDDGGSVDGDSDIADGGNGNIDDVPVPGGASGGASSAASGPKKPRRQCKGRPNTRKLDTLNALLLILFILRCDPSMVVAGALFGVSSATASRYFYTYILMLKAALYKLSGGSAEDTSAKLGSDLFPTHLRNEGYGKVAMIIDATELALEIPSDLASARACYSQYKKNRTTKFLVGLSPMGYINFVSSAFCGKISDDEITRLSDVIDMLPNDCDIMVDRGFTLWNLLRDTDIGVFVPPKRNRGEDKLSADNVRRTRTIANYRIHVERAMKDIKVFKILGRKQRVVQIDVIGSIFQVCAYLTNWLYPPLISKKYFAKTDDHKSEYVLGQELAENAVESVILDGVAGAQVVVRPAEDQAAPTAAGDSMVE